MFSLRQNPVRNALLIAALLPTALFGQEAKPPSASEAAAIAGADPGSLGNIVEKLSPENRKAFGEMLAADWKDRPEWAEMLIPLLKREPIDLGVGWFQPGIPKYDWKWLSAKLDANKDGLIAKDELPKYSPYPELLYSRLDRDGDGELRSVDFDFFSRQPQTPPQMMSRFLSIVLDTDSNGRLTPAELQNWLKGADKDKAGFLTVDDLNEDFGRAFAELNSGGDEMPGPNEMLSMFFRGELGVWGAGPKAGEDAPDFSLPTHDGKQTVTLSKSRGKPVVLIFGSFTCGNYRSQAGLLEKLYSRYKDQVDVYAIYIRDAHPTDGWKQSHNDRVGVSFDQPKTTQARNLIASKCALTLRLSMPLLVDTIDDQVNRAYSGFPNRLYLIDRQGKVVYKGGRGPYGYKPRQLEQNLLLMLLEEKMAKDEGR